MVCNVPTYGNHTVAEHVFGLLLTISHNLEQAMDRTRKGDFSSRGLQGFDLLDKTIGIVGTGDIGLETIRIAKDLLEEIEKKFDRIPNIFATLAYQPEVLRGVVAIDAGLHEDLPAKLRELAYYKASQLNRCEYCSHYHKRAAAQAGVSDEQLAAIDSYQSSDLFNNA